jgi:cyclase
MLDARSQHHPSRCSPGLTERWWINNTGFISGKRTVVSIDTCWTERRTRAYLAVAGEIAGHVPRTLVNTHHH